IYPHLDVLISAVRRSRFRAFQVGEFLRLVRLAASRADVCVVICEDPGKGDGVSFQRSLTPVLLNLQKFLLALFRRVLSVSWDRLNRAPQHHDNDSGRERNTCLLHSLSSLEAVAAAARQLPSQHCDTHEGDELLFDSPARIVAEGVAIV